MKKIGQRGQDIMDQVTKLQKEKQLERAEKGPGMKVTPKKSKY